MEVQQKVSEQSDFILRTAGLFAGSTLGGFGLMKLFTRKKPPVPEINAVLRIVTSGAAYRSHFVGVTPEGWTFTPPLQRDNYVPLKVGEPMIVETVMAGGVMIFQTFLKARHERPSILVAAVPKTWRLEDRRDALRIGEVGLLQTKLDGDRVGLIDISACGARIRSQAARTPGDRVKLEIAGMAEAIYAWVLDTTRKGDRYVVRLRFEEAADLQGLMA